MSNSQLGLKHVSNTAIFDCMQWNFNAMLIFSIERSLFFNNGKLTGYLQESINEEPKIFWSMSGINDSILHYNHCFWIHSFIAEGFFIKLKQNSGTRSYTTNFPFLKRTLFPSMYSVSLQAWRNCQYPTRLLLLVV